MKFNEKALILDRTGISRTLSRLASQIAAQNEGDTSLLMMGIRRRGVPLAERLADKIEKITGCRPLIGQLDITLYRDDIDSIASQPLVKETKLPFNLDDRPIILIDDVLFTGRTIRAALDQLIDFGRPRYIKLAILVDRGYRELPIQPDYVGKKVPTTKKDEVSVKLLEVDGIDEVQIG